MVATGASTERFTAFDGDTITVARRLLGQRLVRVLEEPRRMRLAGIIVEVEAYLGPQDRAAHTSGGRRTPRNESMYLSAGHAYVYFTYGMHYCLNVVCGPVDVGTAVLIRALQPTEGVATMMANRPGAQKEGDLCSGPARLTQALAIDRALDGIDLRTDRRLFIERARRRALPDRRIVAGPRIGVAYAGNWADRPLRFTVRGSRHLSRAERGPE
jgi:DNA-3-methyladenine glycosylase